MTDADIPRRDVARLGHVAEACDRIARYTAGGRSSLDDERTYDAVLRCLTIIGEALAALSDETYAQLGSVPPHLPKAQRNLIVHEYWRIDPEVVWATVERHVPLVRDDAAAFLAPLRRPHQRIRQTGGSPNREVQAVPASWKPPPE